MLILKTVERRRRRGVTWEKGGVKRDASEALGFLRDTKLEPGSLEGHPLVERSKNSGVRKNKGVGENFGWSLY